MADSDQHPLIGWMAAHKPPLRQAQAAERLGVSAPYLSQVLSGKRAVSFKRAVAWSKITGLLVEQFLQTEPAE